MTITYPRDLIEPFGVRAVTFEPLHLQARGAARGGRAQVIGLGPSIWAMRYETVPLAEAQVAEWEAWLSTLRGGLRTFKAWHPMRRHLREYPAGYGGLTRYGGGAFDGTCTLSSISVALDAVILSGLPVGLKIRNGDLVSWNHSSTSQALHRCVEPVDASALGQATIQIEPLARPGSTGTAATLIRPWCHAVIDPASEDVRWSPSQRTATVSFSAMQTL